MKKEIGKNKGLEFNDWLGYGLLGFEILGLGLGWDMDLIMGLGLDK